MKSLYESVPVQAPSLAKITNAKWDAPYLPNAKCSWMVIDGDKYLKTGSKFWSLENARLSDRPLSNKEIWDMARKSTSLDYKLY